MAPESRRITLETLREWKRRGQRFAMLTAYDYPTAAAAHAAGVPSLLIGDSMGSVLLGHDNTRGVPLTLMLTLGEAVRRGAPDSFLIGDLPFEVMRDRAATLDAAARFRGDVGCDAVKLETRAEHAPLVEALAGTGASVIAHLGLRPQAVATSDGYRAQARDPAAIDELVLEARRMVVAGAAMLLLEAVPPEASEAVVSAVDVPVVGCGAGPACDGFVVVTYDMLGLGAARPPRFVPQLSNLSEQMRRAMERYRLDVESGAYPQSHHNYSLRRSSDTAAFAE